MKDQKLFIVNGDKGSRVITKNSLISDIHEQYVRNYTIEPKAKYVEQYAEGLIDELSGQSIEYQRYIESLNKAASMITQFAALNPYTFSHIVEIEEPKYLRFDQLVKALQFRKVHHFETEQEFMDFTEKIDKGRSLNNDTSLFSSEWIMAHNFTRQQLADMMLDYYGYLD